MTEQRLMIVGLGIVLGMIFFHRTGYSPGGVITPGLLALELTSPERVAWVFLFAWVASLALELAVRAVGLYGRQRIGAALLVALTVRIAAGCFLPVEDLWIGWVVPGLVGADMQRQGALPTVGATLATAIAAAMAGRLLAGVPI
ncbi:MAG: capsule biosynthesis protein CapC [Synergistaceae bacterium]|nr:poly-gamma-glutamate biosynthesis protein PgsC/CapC [Synergistota bacterium]NLM71461.1 capsule biosynthesis protein CapC [Synergistaceae bacterium]